MQRKLKNWQVSNMNKEGRLKISVIIPTYNSWGTLRDCLISVQKQTLELFEIIVVDNASSDDTSDKVKKNFPNVRLITLKKNTGVTGGRNTGIRNANLSADYLFFFDHDMVADKNMLKELTKVAEMDPNIGIITPKIYYWGNKKRIWSAGTGINLWTGQILFRGGQDIGQYETENEVQVAPAVLLVKRLVINKLRSFDDRYFATYEDTDFCFRAKRDGFKVFYAPRAIAYHKIPSDPERESRRLLSRAYWIGRNRILFMKDFGSNFLIFTLFLPIYTIYYIRLALRYNKFNSWISFLHGCANGMLTVLIPEKKLPFTSISIIRNAVGDEVRTVLDLGCGYGGLMKAISRDESWEVTGVDADSNSLQSARNTPAYKYLIKGDLETVVRGLIKKKQKFDVVLMSQVIEHLTKQKGERILDLIEKLVIKRIVITTPNGFMEQIEESLDGNIHQEHLSGWQKEDFAKRGYEVNGVGFKLIWSFSGLGRTNFKMSVIIFRMIGWIVAPFTYYFSALGVGLVAVKFFRK